MIPGLILFAALLFLAAPLAPQPAAPDLIRQIRALLDQLEAVLPPSQPSTGAVALRLLPRTP